MYEKFFGLKRRPFAATPDANCWFHSERYQAAIDELLVCAEQGQGVGIVIAPAGIGKTLLCERLVREIGEPFTSVLLRHATYHSRRSFLQTLLSELAQPYDFPTDQELRLALAPVLRGLGQQGRALVLVVDEAHELSEPLLEELRILADQAQEGKPLVRLILCGQLGLEDKLAHPLLRALNQRVRAHVSLLPLSLTESADYLDYRITWAGGRTEELFTPEAVDVICQAADGVPRCLNQLADHALLSAYVAEEQPVTATTVRHALEDLEHLPLAWNRRPLSEPIAAYESDWSSSDDETVDTMADAEPLPADQPEELDVAEPGAGTSWLQAELDSIAQAFQPDAWPADEAAADLDLPPELPLEDDIWQEELVIDRYSALDAGLEPPEDAATPHEEAFVDMVPGPSAATPQDAGALFEQSAADLLATSLPLDEKLELVQQVLEYVSDGLQERVSSEDRHESEPIDTAESAGADFTSQELQAESLGHESLALRDDTPSTSGIEHSVEPHQAPTAAAVIEFGATASEPQRPDYPPEIQSPPRPVRNLFTLLRLKQQGRL